MTVYLLMILLGAVQGAAEFLPISSSGHLALVRLVTEDVTVSNAFTEAPLLLDILLHLATLVAVLIFFRKQVAEAIVGALRLAKSSLKGNAKAQLETDEGALTALCVVIASVPTAVMGLLLSDIVDDISSSPVILGSAFLACAGLLTLSRLTSGGDNNLSVKIALLIGIAQGIAVMPGISRSGATIVAGLILGLAPKKAVSFSFLCSIPAILGAALLEMDTAQLFKEANFLMYSIGALTAFAVGTASLYILSKTVNRGRLWWFAPYVAAVGIFTLLLAAI